MFSISPLSLAFFSAFVSLEWFSCPLLPVIDSWSDDERSECDVGWQSFQTGCYRLTAEKKDWGEAQKACQRMEANLISIHTLPELEFIIRSLKKGEEGTIEAQSLPPGS